MLSSANGMRTYEASQTAARSHNTAERTTQLAALERLARNGAASVFAEAHNDALRAALADSERIAGILQNATLSEDWESAIKKGSAGHGQAFIAQLQQVANVIAARRTFDAEVDVFYIELGGFDNHADVLADTQTNFRNIDVALGTFVKEMKALGVWDQVAVQSLSEFGRTMTSNGAGTDHAWGGNHFVLGGDVRGGIIHGSYPELRINGPDSVSSTGAMLPTKPWDAIWKPLALWLGVEEAQLNHVLPNLHEFSADYLLERDMFE